MPRRPKRNGVCPYCGQHGKLTRDHVIPQCLFPDDEPLPGDIPKIHVCMACNNRWKSEYDVYLRDMLVNDMACVKNPIAQKVREKYFRAAENNQSTMARDLIERAGLVGLQEESGIVSGFALTLPDGARRNSVILPLIVRGLHLYYLHTALPKNTAFKIGRVVEMEKTRELMQEMNEKGGAYQNIGTGDVFQFAFWPRLGDMYPQVWVLNFYRSIRYLVAIRASVPPRILLTSSRLFYLDKWLP